MILSRILEHYSWTRERQVCRLEMTLCRSNHSISGNGARRFPMRTGSIPFRTIALSHFISVTILLLGELHERLR